VKKKHCSAICFTGTSPLEAGKFSKNKGKYTIVQVLLQALPKQHVE